MPTEFPPQAPLSPDQLDKWAERIADSRDIFPVELMDTDRAELAGAIRMKLQDRLLRHVSRAIAARLVDGSLLPRRH